MLTSTVALQVRATGADTVVVIRGRIDAHTVGEIRDCLHEVVDHGVGPIRICVTDAEIGDSVGLGMLVGAHARARRAGRTLTLSEISARTDRLLRASRLNRVLLDRLPTSAASVAPLTA